LTKLFINSLKAKFKVLKLLFSNFNNFVGVDCEYIFLCSSDDAYLPLAGESYSPLLDSLKSNITLKNINVVSYFLPISNIKDTSSRSFNGYSLIDSGYARALFIQKFSNLINAYLKSGSNDGSRNRVLIKFWISFIKNYQPKTIIAIQPPQELCIASNFLGIPILDLQHGVISENWYYNERHESRFKYLSRPSAVLCWDEISASKVVQIWQQVKAITIGNPWVNEFKKNDSNFLKAINFDLSSNSPLLNNENCKIILITTQWEPDGFDRIHIPERIVKLIQATSDEQIKWCIRFHPLEIKAVGLVKLRDYARKVFGEDIFSKITDVSSFPLPQVLLSCTYHITSYSAAVIEASLLGVKSGLWTELPTRQVYFDDYIASGLVEILPEDANEIKKIILNSSPLKHSSSNQNSDGFINYDQIITSALSHA
jgi:hypothetical protein